MTLPELIQATTDGNLLHSDEAIVALKSAGPTITGKDGVALYKAASAQAAQWHAKYLFSPRANPDNQSAIEADLWRSVLDTIVEQLDNADDASLVRACEDVFRYSEMHWVLTYSQAARSGRLNDWLCDVLIRAGHAAKGVGLKDVGVWLYRVAIFPSDSVGRVSG